MSNVDGATHEEFPLESERNTYPFWAPDAICKSPPKYVFPAAIYNEYGLVIDPLGEFATYIVYAEPEVDPVSAGLSKYVK